MAKRHQHIRHGGVASRSTLAAASSSNNGSYQHHGAKTLMAKKA